jgi:hypothetical protein
MDGCIKQSINTRWNRGNKKIYGGQKWDEWKDSNHRCKDEPWMETDRDQWRIMVDRWNEDMRDSKGGRLVTFILDWMKLTHHIIFILLLLSGSYHIPDFT